MSHTPYFRAGVGCVIYTEDNQLVVFKRAGEIDTWQFSQGGIDEGETPEEALWRELFEETALQKIDFTTLTAYPDWTLYIYPPEIYATLKHPNTLGQVQRWWFLRLAPGTTIDLSQTTDNEFSDWKLTSPQEFLEDNKIEWKHTVYQQLLQYYKENILIDK